MIPRPKYFLKNNTPGIINETTVLINVISWKIAILKANYFTYTSFKFTCLLFTVQISKKSLTNIVGVSATKKLSAEKIPAKECRPRPDLI